MDVDAVVVMFMMNGVDDVGGGTVDSVVSK